MAPREYGRDGLDRASGLLDGAAGRHPVLERSQIADVAIAEFLERLAAKRRAAARGAVDDHGLVPDEGGIVVGRIRIGAELDHAARDVDRAGDLAARLDL